MNQINFKELFTKLCKQNKIEISEEQLKKFEDYKDYLLEYNKITNLTAITDPKDIAVKHFIDSMTILNTIKINKNSKIIDIGTGAGFPGIPLKIMRNDINLTLLDSLNKRLIFLNNLCTQKLNLDVNIIHARAEDCNSLNLREKFDIVVSRAVAPLNILLELCTPYISKNGLFIAMKGSNADTEIINSKRSFSTLNCEIVEKSNFILQNDINRTIIVIKKLSPTPKKYPRIYSKIKKNPL